MRREFFSINTFLIVYCLTHNGSKLSEKKSIFFSVVPTDLIPLLCDAQHFNKSKCWRPQFPFSHTKLMTNAHKLHLFCCYLMHAAEKFICGYFLLDFHSLASLFLNEQRGKLCTAFPHTFPTTMFVSTH